MKIGDLVIAGDPTSLPGIILKIDKDFYGARQSFKSHPIPRGQAVKSRQRPDFIDKTKLGIRDRVLVLWPESEYGFSYEYSSTLKVINLD